MKLCLYAGRQAIIDPDAFRDAMSDETFARWVAFDEIDPIGGERIDLAAGVIAAAVMNSGKHGGKVWLPKELMPNFELEPPRPKTKEEQRRDVSANLDRAFAALKSIGKPAEHGNEHRQSGGNDHGQQQG